MLGAAIAWYPYLLEASLALPWTMASLLCFPSFAYFVACCPHPTVYSPQEGGCSDELLPLRERCCTKLVSDAILRQFGDLTPEDMAGGETIIGKEEYVSTLELLKLHLSNFVTDRDMHDLLAWRCLALATARIAVARADDVKDAIVRAVLIGGEELRKVLTQGEEVSRMLTHALFKLENFFQFALTFEAMQQNQMIFGFDAENGRQYFEPCLEVYGHCARTHDFLAYEMLPTFERRLLTPPLVQSISPFVNLLVVSLGNWAKTGFLTIWSVLMHTTSQLRVFIYGDALGLQTWREAVQELQGDGAAAAMLAGVFFEYIDFTRHLRFRNNVLRRYPKGCDFGEAGQAILARVVCHELLPADVDRVISIDLGDLLVLDDIRELWDEGDKLQDHQLMAVAHAVSLHHMNGGLVLYDTKRMRQRNFTNTVLRAARDGWGTSTDQACLRDQSIINILHSSREKFGYEGPSPAMALPCKWSFFPTTEWQPHWNSPEMWLPEIQKLRRYPGIVSSQHIEVFCPDKIDMLSAWAFIPVSSDRQARIRIYSHHEAAKHARYCSESRLGSGDERCCKCGQKVAVVHMPGDLKEWLSVRSLLLAYSPVWKVAPEDDSLTASASKKWQGGSKRIEDMMDDTEKQAILTAKALGLSATFDRCATVATKPTSGDLAVSMYKIQLKFTLPLVIDVETTAPRDAHLMVGDGTSGFELIMGTEDGQHALMRWVRSQPGWTARGDLFSQPYAAQVTAKPIEGVSDQMWSKFRLKIGTDGFVEVIHDNIEWGVPLPEYLFEIVGRGKELTVSVGTQGFVAHWALCIVDEK